MSEPKPQKRQFRAMEEVMKILFLVCGMISVGFVLFISIYLIISGLPAIMTIGPI